MKSRKSSGALIAVLALSSIAFLFCASVAQSQYAPEQAGAYEPVITNGDVNADGQICMDDSIQLIHHLWRDGRDLPCHNAADVDRNGSINLNDVLWGLQHVFFGTYINDCPVTCDGELTLD